MGRILYLECASGISGDMTAAALLDLGADQYAVRAALESLPVEGFEVRISRVVKSGLDVCDFDVVLDAAHENHDHDMAYLHGDGFARTTGRGHSHDHAHVHDCGRRVADDSDHACDRNRDRNHAHAHDHAHERRGLADVMRVIDAADMTSRAKDVARRIFEVLAEAEARAHGVPVEQVHFHEVGAVDSIADVVAIAVAFDSLAVEDVAVCELAEGRGTVRCQHGVIPVPVPAVVNIVSRYGIALKLLDVEGELVTPTGAAVVAALRTEDSLPGRFSVVRVGMGAGKRDYATAGILRAMLIDSLD